MNQACAPEGLLQDRVRERTGKLLADAAAWLRIPPPRAAVRFDLRGRSAGQARLGSPGPALIRYNPALLRANPDDFLASTVPHEVAHLIAFARHGTRIRPHGAEWVAIMRHMGAEPKRCHAYDVSGLAIRRLRELDYHCNCRDHRLTSIRHHRVLAGQTYVCRQCGSPLQPGRHPDSAGSTLAQSQAATG
jgi:SprT protein